MHRSWIKHLTIITFLLFFGCFTYVFLKTPGAGQPQPAYEFWFEDLHKPVALSKQEAGYIMRDIIRGLTDREVEIQELFKPFSSDQSPRIIFISVCDAHTRATVVIGAGHGLAAALQDATVRLRSLSPDGRLVKWLKLDIAEPSDANATKPAYLPSIDHSHKGIAFARETGLAILPTQVVAWRAWSKEGQLLVKNLPAYMQYQLAPPWRRIVARFSGSMRKQLNQAISPKDFSTESFFFDGDETFRLIRGQRVPYKITSDNLLQAIQLAGAYIQHSISPDGKFAYRYLPGTDESTGEYNLVRHAGTIFAMLELYDISRNAELLNNARLAIDYLLGFVRDYGNSHEKMSVLVSDKMIKLGGVALTIVALAKYTEVTLDQKYLPVMVRLARYIRDSQRADGSFISQRYYPDGDVRKDFVSEYYPGEAILALLRLYALDSQQTWLETAEKGAHYLIMVRDQVADTSNLVQDHWLLYALNDLYRYQPRYLYLTHAMRISRAIILSQNRNTSNLEFIGSYYLPPRSTPTAVRTEGLLAAYKMARDAGRVLDADQILEAIALGIGYQLKTQILPEKAMYFDDPQRALGGFHNSFDNYEVRIDYVQHNLSAIMGYYQLLGTDRMAEKYL